MKPLNFDKYRNEKEGKLTPEMLLEDLGNSVQKHNVTELIYIARDSDGEIFMGYSDMADIELVGLIEYGKLGAFESNGNI